MKIKNLSEGILIITDIINVDGSKGLTLQPKHEADVFHGEDHRSAELRTLIASKMIQVVGDENPVSTVPVKKEEAKSAPVAPKPASAPKVEKKKSEVKKSAPAKKAKGK